MSKKIWAIFSDEAYEDLMSGKAVDNNGFRSPKGNFRSDQPSFCPVNHRSERLMDAAVDLGIVAGGYVTTQIVLPGIKQFCTDKVYPFLCEKWDAWKARHDAKKAAASAPISRCVTQPAEDGKSTIHEYDNVISIEKFRKASNE